MIGNENELSYLEQTGQRKLFGLEILLPSSNDQNNLYLSNSQVCS